MHRLTTHDAFFDIHLIKNQGWAVGDHGVLLRTEDGGNTWHRVDSLTDMALLGIDMTSQGRGVAVGQGGVILYTEDNGKHWSKAGTEINARLFSVSLDDGGVGLAVGEFGTLLRTNDHGKSWEALALDWGRLVGVPEVPHLYDVLMEDRNTAMIVGEFGIIMRTRDAGRNWSLLNQGHESIFTIRKSANSDYWGLGQSGLLLRTRDSGLNWEKIEIGQQLGLLDLHLDERGRGILIEMEGLLTTADSGQTWHSNPRMNLPHSRYYAVAAAKDGGYLLAGAFGSILRVNDSYLR